MAEYLSQRRSIRLKAYDYTSTGAYFVTICAHNREPLFQDPALGEILERTWSAQQKGSPSVSFDGFVVMPNHVHFIIWLNPVGAPLAGARPPLAGARGLSGRAGASPAPTLGQVVGAFKSVVATQWLKWSRRNAPHRLARVWQRNYYERIIRNDRELDRIRQYIQLNPLKWEFDRENPDCVVNHGHQSDWGWLEAEQVASRPLHPLPLARRNTDD